MTEVRDFSLHLVPRPPLALFASPRDPYRFDRIVLRSRAPLEVYQPTMYSDDMNTRGLRVRSVVGVLFSTLHLLQTEARVRDTKGAPSSIQE